MFRPLIRMLSLFEQWGAEVVRQPALMFSLIVAPFLLLFAFGEGVELAGPRPHTVIVQAPDSDVDVERLLQRVDQSVVVVGISESLPLARRSLERGDIHAVILVPEDPEQFIEAQEQIPVRVLIGEIDPVRRSYARSYMREQIAALNQQAVAEALGEAQASLHEVDELTGSARDYVGLLADARDDVTTARQQVRELREALDPLSRAVHSLSDATDRAAFALPGLSRTREQTARLRDAVDDLQQDVDRLDQRLEATEQEGGLPTDAEIRELETSLESIDRAVQELSALPPEVMSAPFRLEMEDLTPVEPTFTTFYAPGVLALLLQHLAITLGALTMARMRLLRVTEMLRVAPIRPSEVVLGSYLSYTILSALAAAGLLAMLLLVLDVPVIGSYLIVAGLLALLILCALGVGFVISMLSASVQQAVQVAMLILLGSIFFSGFAFSLDQISWPVRAIAHVFPATYGIRTLQDVMLRGLIRHPEDFVILAVAAICLFGLTVYLMRREFRPE